MNAAAKIPRPGSAEARELGCTCPVIDYDHGASDGGDWWYNRLCLVHREEIAGRMNCAAAVSAEVKERRRHWIGGVPTPADVDALVRQLAHRLKVPETVIRETLGPITSVP